MYGQLLYFIVALLLFTMQQPGKRPLLPLEETILLGIGTFLIFALLCYVTLRRLRLASLQDLPQSTLALRYHRIQSRLSILALVILGVYVYALNIKYYLKSLPGFEESVTLFGLVGLGLFLFHLGIIWYWSHPIYQRIYRSNIKRAAFLKGQLSFSSAILIPWLLISFISDLLQFIRIPAFLNNEAGEFLTLFITLIFFVLFAPSLVVRLWGCRSLEGTGVRAELETFCRLHQFRVADFMLWPLMGGETLTAGIMGILPKWRYILITRGLLSLLNTEELEAVVGHEMGHVRRYHLVFYLILFLSFSWLIFSVGQKVFHYTVIEDVLLFLMSHDIFLEGALAPDTLHLTLFSLAYTLPFLLALVIYFRYVFGFFMRNSERQADLYALQLIGHPFTLISSLRKIALYSGSIEDLPSWHHFSIRQRMDFLLASYNNSALIRRHDRKLYGTALLFLTLVITLGMASVNLEEASLFRQWRNEVRINFLERELIRKPRSPEVYTALGGFLIEAGRHTDAERTLNKALELAPEDPVAMNNMAWLYATSPPPHSHPEKSLQLAIKAAALDPVPNVLDTLAEAYYVNGRYQEAVATIEEALAKGPKNREYFLKQKRKFEEALENRRGG